MAEVVPSKATLDLASRIRAQLLRTAKSATAKAGCKGGEIAVPMSAGVDSHCALFTQLQLGYKPKVFSFHLEGVDSRDFRIAQNTARLFDLKFIEVVLPSSLDTLQKDVKRLAMLGARSKTDYECFWPMLYLLPAIAASGCKLLFTGHGADSLFCMSRKANQHFKGREDAFRDAAFANKNAFQRHLITRVCNDLGLSYCPIFYTQAMRRVFLGATPDVMHKPIEKAASRLAFPEDFDRVRVYTHTSFQLGDSGIQTHFEALLGTDLNPNRSFKSVRGVYNRLNCEYETRTTTRSLFS